MSDKPKVFVDKYGNKFTVKEMQSMFLGEYHIPTAYIGKEAGSWLSDQPQETKIGE